MGTQEVSSTEPWEDERVLRDGRTQSDDVHNEPAIVSRERKVDRSADVPYAELAFVDALNAQRPITGAPISSFAVSLGSMWQGTNPDTATAVAA